MPHVLIEYAHVLICISAGKGSRHFSAFIFIVTIAIWYSFLSLDMDILYVAMLGLTTLKPEILVGT